ncbi:hypothetical protein RDABS01_001456 [Bienertia sinuspersici]
MAKLQKVEGQTELKCHADKFFDAWACKPLQIPKMCANKITKLEVQEGECHKSLFAEHNGVAQTTFSLTTRVEELDVEKRVIRYSYHGGFILEKYYKTFKSKMQVTPKNGTNEGCFCELEL